jgi:hypothetical protein
MLQLVLSNTEKSRLRSAIADMKGSIAAKGNEPLSEFEMRRNTELCKKHFTTLCRLKALLPQTSKETALGREARVEFVKTIWLAGILSEVRNYAFYDIFDVGDRQYDTCFEMGDGTEVMHALVRKARRSKALRAEAVSLYSESDWRRYENEAAQAA